MYYQKDVNQITLNHIILNKAPQIAHLMKKKRFSSAQDYIQVDQSRHLEVVPQCYLR